MSAGASELVLPRTLSILNAIFAACRVGSLNQKFLVIFSARVRVSDDAALGLSITSKEKLLEYYEDC
jgi:hypothetical protein